MKIWLLIFCALLPLSSNAAQLSIDLSAEQLEAQLADSQAIERIDILAQLIWLYRNNNFKKAIEYGDEALKLLESNPHPKLKTQILHSLAWAQMRAGQYDKAVELANTAIDNAIKFEDKEGQAFALNVLGSVEWYKGNFLTALDYFLKTLDIRKSIGDKLNIARSYNNIGSVYQEINDFQEAREYHELSSALMEELGNKYGVATSYFNLGIINQRLGDEKKEEYYLEKANIAFTELADEAALSEVQINLGYLKLKQHKLDVALAFFKLSQYAAEQLHNQSLLARSILGQGDVAFQKSDFKNSQRLVINALKISEKLAELTQIRDANKLLADIYQAQGNFELALDAYKKFDTAKDAVLSNVYEGKLTLLQQKFDVQQSKTKIALLEKEKAFSQQKIEQAELESTLLYYGLGLICFFVAVIIYQYLKLVKKSHLNYLLSITDNLCRCYNRNYLFSDLIPTFVEQQHPIFSLLLDLDNFKKVNDQYGHDIGDKLLVEFTRRINSVLAGEHYLIRVGGEEFVVLGQNKTEAEVHQLATAIKNEIAGSAFKLSENLSLEITCSIGVSLGDAENESALVALIKEADLAMYQAKKEGRNRVVTAFR